MKKLVVVVLIFVILLLGTNAVFAGGDKVQEQNPGYNQVDESDHNTIAHCFKEIDSD